MAAADLYSVLADYPRADLFLRRCANLELDGPQVKQAILRDATNPQHAAEWEQVFHKLAAHCRRMKRKRAMMVKTIPAQVVKRADGPATVSSNAPAANVNLKPVSPPPTVPPKPAAPAPAAIVPQRGTIVPQAPPASTFAAFRNPMTPLQANTLMATTEFGTRKPQAANQEYQEYLASPQNAANGAVMRGAAEGAERGIPYAIGFASLHPAVRMARMAWLARGALAARIAAGAGTVGKAVGGTALAGGGITGIQKAWNSLDGTTAREVDNIETNKNTNHLEELRQKLEADRNNDNAVLDQEITRLHGIINDPNASPEERSDAESNLQLLVTKKTLQIAGQAAINAPTPQENEAAVASLIKTAPDVVKNELARAGMTDPKMQEAYLKEKTVNDQMESYWFSQANVQKYVHDHTPAGGNPMATAQQWWGNADQVSRGLVMAGLPLGMIGLLAAMLGNSGAWGAMGSALGLGAGVYGLARSGALQGTPFEGVGKTMLNATAPLEAAVVRNQMTPEQFIQVRNAFNNPTPGIADGLIKAKAFAKGKPFGYGDEASWQRLMPHMQEE